MTIDNETQLLLNAYHDGELSPGEALSMQRRIELEPELAEFARQLVGLSTDLTGILPGEPAPERLRGAVLASLSSNLENDAVEDERTTDEGLKSVASSTRSPGWSIAAALIIGLFGGGLGGGYIAHVTQGEIPAAAVENEIVAAHLRALVAPRPFDIASTESHIVKPWFNGKTTIAPTTPDFAAQGFPLVGGRVDVIGRRPVPVLVYKRREHTISVTVTASSNKAASAQEAIDGTNVTSWRDGDLVYWAASDLNAGELSSFAELYRERVAGAR